MDIATVASAIAILTVVFFTGRWIEKVNSDRTTLREFIDAVGQKLDTILERLPQTTTKPGSPLQLTKLGQDISDELGIKQWAQEKVDSLSDDLHNKQPYEIEEYCYDYVRKNLHRERDQMKLMSQCAYENGIKISQIFEIYALEMRDMFVNALNLESPKA